jgi:antitoxin (DNA-binding transcriptional repressor) of toxin-antitoxin stability system
VSTVTLDELPSRLPQLIDQLRPGEAVVVTRGDKPVARITAEPPARIPRKAGNCVGMAVIVADDDAHLVDFKEYME